MLETKLINILQKAMDGSSTQNMAISNNIANVNTPGYKKQIVTFQEELEKSINQANNHLSLKRTSEKHLTGREPVDQNMISISEINNTKLRNDGNNVDVDMELAALAENTLYFNSLIELLSSQLSLLRTSISEGRR